MLRTGSARLGQPAWRSSSLFAIRYESTAAATAPASTDQNGKTRLSQRLGGSGRGKLIDSNEKDTDVFASFLAQAQKKQNQRSRINNNNTNNKPRRPDQRREAKPGQFDDAVEAGSQRQQGNGNNRQRKSQQQGQQQASNKDGGNNKNQGQEQRDRRLRQQNRRDGKKSTSYGTPSNHAVLARRATTFIDRDIDWTSLSPVDQASVANDGADEVSREEKLRVEAELNSGDYAPLLSVGQSIQWPAALDTRSLESLVSSNASYGLDQKMTFLAAVAKATNIGESAVKR